MKCDLNQLGIECLDELLSDGFSDISRYKFYLSLNKDNDSFEFGVYSYNFGELNILERDILLEETGKRYDYGIIGRMLPPMLKLNYRELKRIIRGYMAHEMGHVMKGHLTPEKWEAAFSNREIDRKQEREADLMAISKGYGADLLMAYEIFEKHKQLRKAIKSLGLLIINREEGGGLSCEKIRELVNQQVNPKIEFTSN